MQGAQGEQCLRALERPDHARLLEAVSDDGLARAFDDARSDEPAVRPVLVVFHPSCVAAEVLVLAHGVALELVAHSLPQVVEDVLHLAGPDAFRPVAVAVVPLLRPLLDPEAQKQRLEVFDGMVDVEDFDGEGEVAFVDGVKPLAAVGDVEDRFRKRLEASVELGPHVLAELLPPVRRRDIGRRVDVAVGLVVLCLRRDEYRARLDFPRLCAAVLSLCALQALPAHRHSGSVSHDADDLRSCVCFIPFPGSDTLDERRGSLAVEADDLADRVCGDLEGVVP